LPVSVSRQRGEYVFTPSAGGLATGLASVAKSLEMHWIGWPGMPANRLSDEDREQMRALLGKDRLHPVFLSRREIEQYYYGFSNKTIWPLFHYFELYALYKDFHWKAYVKVNQLFCDAVMELAEPGDRIWVHDYQLLLLPEMLRQRLPEASIGFFLHIPFPSSEVFRTLPWRSEILNGMLGADVVGFHTYDYVRHFLSSAARIEGVEHSLGRLIAHDRLVTTDAFPMGIDYERYASASERPEVQHEVSRIRDRVGHPKIILSIDRLDYTKGIIERVEAFDLFLSENPEYKEQVSMILLTVPSRSDIDRYRELRRRLEALVGRINGEHGTIGWSPIWYLYRWVPFDRLSALYTVADVALVTPLRDGMNLIAKEFIAAKAGATGVLVLSEMAGAASELGEAITVNPKNKRALIEAIQQALEMPNDEQIRRNKRMQDRLSRYTVHRWAHDFLDALERTKRAQQKLVVKNLSADAATQLVAEYRKSRKRLLFLDYDGTLVRFFKKAEDAVPDPQLLELLHDLAHSPDNTVVVVSGRDRHTLETWFADVAVSLVAEHGGWVREAGQAWEPTVGMDSEWKDTIRPILDLYADRTPGSSVEEKDFALVWHVRGADGELASLRQSELRDAVHDLTANLDVGVFEGDKIFEIKRTGVDKGRAVARWLLRNGWDFILAIGDDYTDEDMFGALPAEAYSIKVGRGISRARFSVRSVFESRELLVRLTRS
jgi:trehalose 6-phosphate synthase/phosphatase